MPPYPSSGNSPADIITYIGVPLAVIGVLPIVYSFVASLFLLQKVNRRLKANNIKASTRSDIFNCIVEVEYSRYAITSTLDQYTPESVHSKPSPQASNIPGGTWMAFEWYVQEIGKKTQRVQCVNQLRQPQAEVNFRQLVTYLHTRGATPDREGWTRLRQSGLWMPKGCSLMNLATEKGTEKALVVALMDDSDGNLSLATEVWSSIRLVNQGPPDTLPNCIKLPPPPPNTLLRKLISNEMSDTTLQASSQPDASSTGAPRKSWEQDGPSTWTSKEKEQDRADPKHIFCQIAAHGLANAYRVEEGVTPPYKASDDLGSLHLLKENSRHSSDVWFASIATALHIDSRTLLWTYRIPDGILEFAKTDIIPYGVLIELGVLDSADYTGQTINSLSMEKMLDVTLSRNTAQTMARDAEANMTYEQRQLASHNRSRQTRHRREEHLRQRIQLEAEARQAHMGEILQSPKCGTTQVAELNLIWLKAQGYFPESYKLQDAASIVLYCMVVDRHYAFELCSMLDRWNGWGANGGMSWEDLDALQKEMGIFAQASLLVAVLERVATEYLGTLVDVQACLDTWKIVRFG